MRNSRAVFPLAVTARRPARIVPLLAAVAVGLAGLSSARSAEAQTVVSSDFEDGTTQGWIPARPRPLTNTTEPAIAGTRSLKTTGPHRRLQRAPRSTCSACCRRGATYQVTVSVRLVAGERRDPAHRHHAADARAARTQFDRVVASAATGHRRRRG